MTDPFSKKMYYWITFYSRNDENGVVQKTYNEFLVIFRPVFEDKMKTITLVVKTLPNHSRVHLNARKLKDHHRFIKGYLEFSSWESVLALKTSQKSWGAPSHWIDKSASGYLTFKVVISLEQNACFY